MGGRLGGSEGQQPGKRWKIQLAHPTWPMGRRSAAVFSSNPPVTVATSAPSPHGACLEEEQGPRDPRRSTPW